MNRGDAALAALLLRLSTRDVCVAVCAVIAGCATGEDLGGAGGSIDGGPLGSGGSSEGTGGAPGTASGGTGGALATASGGTGGATGTASGGTGGATGTASGGTGGATGSASGGTASTGGAGSADASSGGNAGTGGAPQDGGGAGGSGGGASSGDGSTCASGANQDGDRYTDCEEDADAISSTSKYVWNGVTASLVGNGGGNCTEICLASQIASLFASPLETHAIYSGWEFNTDQPESQSSNSATFGFQPPFTASVTGFRVLYRGEFWVPPSATGQYCFNVDIGSDGGSGNTDTSPDACGAIYLPDVQTNAWVMNGRHQSSTSDSPPMPSESNQRTKCTTFATAGPQRIDFVYQYSGNSVSNRHQMHVKYCYGNASPCTPATLIDDAVLTRVSETIPTCADGVQNGGETGVDCGGPDCAPC